MLFVVTAFVIVISLLLLFFVGYHRLHRDRFLVYFSKVLGMIG